MLKKALISAVAVGSLFGAVALAPRSETPAPSAAPAAYAVDGVHSFVTFRCKHLNTSYAYGAFHKISGTISFDEAAPEASSMTIEVDTASVSTGDAKRDGHLKSADFFSASEFPKATFKSKSFKKTGDNSFDVAGDFTLRGVTKPLTIKLEKTGSGKNPMAGNEIVGFESTFTINRMDFGVKYGDGMLGNDVRVTVAIEAGKK